MDIPDIDAPVTNSALQKGTKGVVELAEVELVDIKFDVAPGALSNFSASREDQIISEISVIDALPVQPRKLTRLRKGNADTPNTSPGPIAPSTDLIEYVLTIHTSHHMLFAIDANVC
jgi:hypothetical protein